MATAEDTEQPFRNGYPVQVEALSGRLSPLPKSRAKLTDGVPFGMVKTVPPPDLFSGRARTLGLSPRRSPAHFSLISKTSSAYPRTRRSSTSVDSPPLISMME